jgi:tripartite-type tricarboxylate transporter receptor subunit TctC
MNRLFAFIVLAAWSAPAALAAVYPDRPIRLIVPYPPGANIDITARMAATCSA